MLNRMCTSIAVTIGLGLASPVLAAENIGCIDTGYTPEQRAMFATFQEAFSINATEGPGSLDSLMPVIGERAGVCAAAHNWNEEAVFQALTYKVAGAMEQALAARSPLTARQMELLSIELADKGSTIRKFVLPAVEAELRGEPAPQLNESQETEMGLALIAAGLPNDEKVARFIGEFVGARLMREVSMNNFSKL